MTTRRVKVKPQRTHVDTRPQDRYSNLLNDVFSLFSSVEWEAENFLIVPKGHITGNTNEEFGRFDIVTGSRGFKDSLSGIMFIDIFTPNGAGPKRAYQIADLFDKFFAGQSLATQGDKAITQFRRESNFEVRGEDARNPSLLRSTYQIGFSHFRKEK